MGLKLLDCLLDVEDLLVYLFHQEFIVPDDVFAVAGVVYDPGLGITIDEDKLMAQVGEPREYKPRFDPDDGSVIDW